MSFTHTINVISTPTYLGSAECKTNADDACFTSATEAKNLNVFSVDLTDLSAINFTIKAGITDRNYIASNWTVVHRIKQGTSVLGFKAWEISFGEVAPTWTGALTPNTAEL